MRMGWAAKHWIGETMRRAQGVAGSQTGSPPRTPRTPRKALTTGGTGEPALFLAAFAWRFPLRGFLLWRSCHDQVIRLANQGSEFAGGQDVGVCQKDPFVAADVRGGGDAFDFEEFVECFGCAFEANGREAALREVDDGEELASHLEAEVFSPLNVFGRVREGEAEFADPFDVWHVGMIAREWRFSENWRIHAGGAPAPDVPGHT